MDTSRNFNSPTVAFVTGDGTYTPTPTPWDLVEILHDIGRRLRKDDLLDHVVGNRNVFSDNSEAWDLREGIAKAYRNGRNNAPHAYSSRLRARKIYSGGHSHSSVSGHPYLQESIHLGYDHGEFMWFWLMKHCSDSDLKGPAYCYDLMSPGARTAFEDSDMPRGKYFGLTVLQSLDKILKDEVEERRHRLTKLEAGSTIIDNMVNRFGSALLEPRTSGDGFEG